MAYIAPIHRASSVRNALKLNLLDPEDECLVVAKVNRLEIYVQTAEGLSIRHTKGIHGQIVVLEKIRPESSLTDHLFIVTDRHFWFTLSWDAVAEELHTETEYIDITDRHARDSQNFERCFVDPRRRFFTLSLYEGIYTILIAQYKQALKGYPQVDLGTLAKEVIPVRTGEILLRSSCYLHYKTQSEKENPRLASLYQDNHNRAWLKVKVLEPLKSLDNINVGEQKVLLKDKLDVTASHLIPVPNPINGLLILSETCITWVNPDNDISKMQPLDEATIWGTWTQIDDNRWLLADEYGFLYFLMINFDADSQELHGFKLDKLGLASRATVLVYLDAGCVFIGSHTGDSQVIRIVERGLEVVQTLSNIGPIVDMAVMDLGNRGSEGQINEFSSGQARLITGSGAFGDGTLRSIRSGVGVEEIGSLGLYPSGSGPVPSATNMFHLSVRNGYGLDDLLMVSYSDETRIFNFSADGSVEEIQTMVINEPTILAEKISGSQSRYVQCTSRSVTIYIGSEGSLRLLASWQVTGEHNIVTASMSDKCIVVSLAGIELVTIDITENSIASGQLAELARRRFEKVISCVDIPNIAPTFMLVGFWETTNISVLGLPDLRDVHSAKIGDDPAAVPRSVLLTQVLPNHPPTLFVALGDGNVVTFDVDKPTFALSDRQTTMLGSLQAILKILPRNDGLFSVFAISEHSTLIYGSEGRLVYSAVTAENATCICSFDAVAYPEAVAVATPKELKIAMVERERTTHVQTLPVGETVRRIAYSADLHAFGMGTIKRQLTDGVELVTSSFKLVDEVMFDVLSEWPMNEDEITESACRMRLEEEGREVERFVVGTTYMAPEADAEHPRGRILVFRVTEDRVLKLVVEHKVKGACRTLAQIDGKIAAGLIKTLTLYAYEYGALQRKCSYRCATAPIDTYVDGDKIVISDVMKSVAIVKYTRGENGLPDKLEEIARHFQTVWSTAVAPVDHNTTLETDADGNILHLAHNATPDELAKRRLETISEMNIGEMVNRIRTFQVPATSSALVVPRAFLATVNGGIYFFGQIRSDMQHELMELQGAIAKHVKSPGNIPWSSWRACRTEIRQEKEPLRFVDGDLVESFLHCDTESQEAIVQEVKTTVPKVKAMIETLRRMR